MARKKSIIPGFSLNRALGITSAKQKIARATGIPTTKQGRKRKIQSHLWTAAAVGVAAACSTPKRSAPPRDDNHADDQHYDYDSAGYDPEPPKRKPLYKRVWFWILVVLLVSGLKTRIAKWQAESNKREEARVLAELAERERQKQAEAVASEPDPPAEEKQPSATEDHYTSDDPAPEQEETEAEDAAPETSDTATEVAAPETSDTTTGPAASEATGNVTTIVVPVTPSTETTASSTEPVGQTYVLNTSTHKFHYQSCSSVKKIDPENYSTYTGTRDSVISMGYEACGRCHP